MAYTKYTTVEAAEAKASELSITHNKQITSICLQIGEDDLCVGFVKKPNRDAKAIALTAFLNSVRTNGVTGMDLVGVGLPMLEGALLLDESDPRMNPFIGGDDDIVNSAAVACFDMLKFYMEAAKKK